MTPPAAQMFNSQSSNHHHDSNRGGRSARCRGRGRGRSQGPSEQPRKFFCHFHGAESDHTTNHCTNKKKTLKRMEAEKMAKLVGHTSCPGSANQTYNLPQLSQTYNPLPPNHPYNPTPSMLTSTSAFSVPFQPALAFSYKSYPANWQSPQPNTQRAPPQTRRHNPQEELPPLPPGLPPKQETPNPQQSRSNALPTFGMIMAISGGSSLEFDNKRQIKNYFRQVHSIISEGV